MTYTSTAAIMAAQRIRGLAAAGRDVQAGGYLLGSRLGVPHREE